MIRASVLACVAFVGLALPAAATSVFYDDFSGDAPALQTTLQNFNVTGGIDVVGASNPYGITTPGGNVVDLDGTTGPGLITSKASYTFNAGDRVSLSVLVGGAQRGSVSDGFYLGFFFGSSTTLDNVSVTGQINANFGGPFPGSPNFSTGIYALSGAVGFINTVLSFTALTAGSLNFFLQTDSADNVGPLVTNVNLDISPSAVPVPAAGLMLLAGLGALTALRRKRV